MAAYHIVYAEPNPFTGARYVVGALVYEDPERDAFAHGEPAGGHCAPRGAADERLWMRLRSRLMSCPRVESARNWSPYCTVSRVSQIPNGVDGPVAWVRSLMAE